MGTLPVVLYYGGEADLSVLQSVRLVLQPAEQLRQLVEGGGRGLEQTPPLGQQLLPPGRLPRPLGLEPGQKYWVGRLVNSIAHLPYNRLSWGRVNKQDLIGWGRELWPE